jgi:redox-sensing transcriptional repressor
MNTNLGKNYIIRLSEYKNALSRFKTLGFVKVFSDNLADSVRVTSVQVRKDFSLFGISGNRRGGYLVKELIEKLNDILGKNEIQRVVLAGVGHLGTALMRYKGFEKEGIKIVACFDIDPTKTDKKAERPILLFDELFGFVKKNGIKIGIISVPENAAQEVAEKMMSAGIKGILNFAPIKLRGEEDCIINYVNVAFELENLSYFVNAMQKDKRNKEGGK